jgi:hypothetical protein
MSEETAFDTMAVDLLNALGLDATYYPKIGESVALKVFYEQGVEYNPDGYPGQGQDFLRTIEFLYSDIGAIPAAGDYFLIGSTRFYVEKTLENEGNARFCKVVVNDIS